MENCQFLSNLNNLRSIRIGYFNIEIIDVTGIYFPSEIFFVTSETVI